MLILKLAVRNLLRHPTKTALVGALIGCGVAFMFLANAIFESSDRGLERSLVGSLTGHLAIGADGVEAYGLFGSEIPIVSDFETIPPLPDYSSVRAALEETEGISAWAPIVSAAAQIRIGSYAVRGVAFGVEPDSYFRVCGDIEIVRGTAADIPSEGVSINQKMARAAEKHLGRKLRLGEPVVFATQVNGTFRFRRAALVGVHRYPAPTDALDRVVLADPVVVRSLCDYTLGYAQQSGSAQATLIDTGDIDGLFGDTADVAAAEGQMSLGEIERELSDTADRDRLVLTDDAAWSFALVRVENVRTAGRIKRSLDLALDKLEAGTRTMDWRTSAGASATLLFAVRTAFGVAVSFIALGAVLVVMNGLVISVLERTDEIASMRALGASRLFICALFGLETMTLTSAAAAAGIVGGLAATTLLSRTGIELSNPLFIAVFGGSLLRPETTLRAVVDHFLAASLLGACAWVYPVTIAFRKQPARAMMD